MERFPLYLRLSERVPGWTRGPEAEALIRTAYGLPQQAIIVEIGAFLGSGSILLAGARKLRRSGRVHCVDPFDASGDAFSVPHYQSILTEYGKTPQIQVFRNNLLRAGLANWFTAHQGSAQKIGLAWNTPVDMIFMDGDQSPEGVLSAWNVWERWLKPNGVVALHNSALREYAPEHDGHFQLRQRLLEKSNYSLIEEAGSTSIFRRDPAIATEHVREDLPKQIANVPIVDKVDAIPRSPVFIVGSSRSGTSALVMALEAAGYRGHREGNFLPLMKIIDRIIDSYLAQPGHSHPDHLTAKINSARLKDGINATFKEIEEENHPFPLWFDKSALAEMIYAIPIVKRLWPQSVFIFCKRRGIENVLSRLTKFPTHDFEFHCADWANFMAGWRSMRTELPAGDYIEVDQQDLILDTEAVCTKIAELLQLGEERRRNLTNTVKLKRPQETTKGSATRLHSLQSIGWSESQLAIFQRYCAPEMQAYGYGSGSEYYIKTSE